MDWIGDRVFQPIEKGKALWKEVVMNDLKKDEVDDGPGFCEDLAGGELESPTS